MSKSTDIIYLKPNAVPEALFNQWYVNSHLISPLTAALNVKERHLKIMESYIEHPKAHAEAVERPEMRGGPFIDYRGERVEEIKALYLTTVERSRKLLRLADAAKELHMILQEHAKGYSLQGLYEMVPDPLRGYVELTYDLSNQATYRIIEALLYKEYYDETLQSIALQLIESDNSRSFVLSTPRLDNPSVVRIVKPFRHECYDELFKMMRKPASYGGIKEILNIDHRDDATFRTFFREQAPPPYNNYNGTGIRTRYFGHASILIETRLLNLLVDPVISYEYDADLHRYTFNDLPKVIDFVLITHNHQDHVNIETLLQIRHKVRHIIVPRCALGNLQDPSLKILLNKIGFTNVIELSEMEEIKLDECTITGLPFFGEHSDLDIRSKLCYHLRLKNNLSIMLAADSCNIQPKTYELVRSEIGAVDVLFLGMECDGAPLSWVYGPLMPVELERDKDQSRRLAGCDFDQAFDLVNCFNPAQVFVYAMGMEPWLEYISSVRYTDQSRPVRESNKLIQRCLSLGIHAERLYGEKTIDYQPERSVQIQI